MGLCASNTDSSFSPPKSPGGKLRVVPGGGSNKYGINQNTNNSKFIINAGNFSTIKLIKRTEDPPESLKLCKINGQGERKVSLKLYHKEVLESNTMLLEKIIDASDISVDMEHSYILRLYHSFHSASSRIWYIGTTPFIMDLVHYMDRKQRDGLDLKVGKQIGAEVALGLEALHQAEQVHGELRPGNILIKPSGHVVISLYPVQVFCTGEPKLYHLDDTRFEPPASTSTDDTMMTYTRMDDWWCYGLILYQIFHGKPLFDGDTINDIEEQKNARPTITIKPSEKMLLNSPLHKLLQGFLMIDEKLRFGMKELLQSSFLEENNSVDWKKTRYGETNGIEHKIDITDLPNYSHVEEGVEKDNIDNNWEYDVSLLDGEQNSEVEEGVDAVLLGVIGDSKKKDNEVEGSENTDEKNNSTIKSESELFDSLCNRWDKNIEVDTLNQFSINLKTSKFDKFVAYGTKVKAKTGREMDEENLKQFKLLNETVHNTSSKVNAK